MVRFLHSTSKLVSIRKQLHWFNPIIFVPFTKARVFEFGKQQSARADSCQDWKPFHLEDFAFGNQPAFRSNPWNNW
ncbi:hypothetical protein ERO13_D01G044650v2 [Gossypium hirsutum]|nr:hypothetical protein ERO13_D01G044650v2 [Gossypium hirsutum]